MSMLFSLVICLSFASIYSQQTHIAQGKIIYVTPGDESLCPDDVSPCKTLNWYNQNSANSSFMTNNTEVRFLNGVHILNSTVSQIINCYNLTIVGFQTFSSFSKNKPQTHTVIECNASLSLSFMFINSREIHIMNIGFDSCGVKINAKHNVEIGGTLLFKSGSNIFLDDVVVNNSKGYAVHIDSSFGTIVICQSSFLRTRAVKVEKVDGSVNFQFKSTSASCSETNLRITSSKFLDGHSVQGLHVIVDCPNVIVTIENATVTNNKGGYGGNVALYITDFGQSMNTSIISLLNSHINNGKAEMGGGLRVKLRTKQSQSSSTCIASSNYTILYVYNTTFYSNHAGHTGGAIYVTHSQSVGYNVVNKHVEFSHCTFEGNIGNRAVIEIKKQFILAVHKTSPPNVKFKNCEFYNNWIQNYHNEDGRIINVIRSHVDMSNCTLSGNCGTVIALQQSFLNFYHNVIFENNSAMYGGALKLYEGSYVLLHNQSHVSFINNTAQIGGAVFIEQTCLDYVLPCAFQPAIHKNISIENIMQGLQLDFVNNSASIAGDAVYGGCLKTCYTFENYSYNGRPPSTHNFFHILEIVFNLKGRTDPSLISSNPQGVCLCNNNESLQHIICQKNHTDIDVYPGQSFSISAVTVGQLNGKTSGSIQSTLVNETSLHKLVNHKGEGYSNQCESLSYTLCTNRSRATILLSPSGPKYYHTQRSVNITLSFKMCPLAFELVTDAKDQCTRCDCHRGFRHKEYIWHPVHCDINTQTIHVPSGSESVWFGCHESRNRSHVKNPSTCDKFIVSQNCYDYCRYSDRNVSIHKLDEQCLDGRTGVLCGACKKGLSRVHGTYMSQECRVCSNSTLWWYILSKLLCCVLLVIFLPVLNITVTEGTINGLFLYTTVLYSYTSDSSLRGAVLWSFISMLNLEVSWIKCVYDGMTGYQYISLLFGEVFCLLFIQAIIVFLCHKFIFFTRLFGRNVLKVLATLQFVTYSPLLYAIIHTIRLVQVHEYSQNGQKTIKTLILWYYDGNLQYFGIKHTILFIVALICLLVSIFLILCLLFVQCLQKRSSYRCLRWVNRLRPYFETYTGPCNDSYRFWPGLLYLMRTMLYSAGVFLGNRGSGWHYSKMLVLSTSFILLICLACIFPHGVYKKWPINVLEFSFLLNLCIVCIGLGFSLDKHRRHLLDWSASVALITCLGILLYHIYQWIKGTCVWIKLKELISVHSQNFRNNQKHSDECRDPLLPRPFPAVAHFD